MNLTLRRHTRRTPDQIEQLLEQYYCSGQTQAEFASEHGIGLSTLQRWLGSSVRKARPPKASVEPAWLEVAAAAPSLRAVATRSYRVDLPGGISLRMEGGFDATELEQLLRVLR